MPLGYRIQTILVRTVAAMLRAFGLRGQVFAWQQERKRRRRAKLEARGDDRLSRPAAFGMDLRLDAVIDRDGGYFIEAGANDGYVQSNTYWLERFRGWSGLLVEAMPELADEARRNRPDAAVVQTALVPEGYGQDTIRMTFGDLMTRVSSGDGKGDAEWAAGGLQSGWRDPYEAEVPAQTLSAVLDSVGAPEVDLLSLDVEGFEPHVLAGLDLERHAPRWIAIEVHDLAEHRPPIDAALGDRYVVAGRLSPSDLLYRRTDVPAPADGLLDPV